MVQPAWKRVRGSVAQVSGCRTNGDHLEAVAERRRRVGTTGTPAGIVFTGTARSAIWTLKGWTFRSPKLMSSET